MRVFALALLSASVLAVPTPTSDAAVAEESVVVEDFERVASSSSEELDEQVVVAATSATEAVAATPSLHSIYADTYDFGEEGPYFADDLDNYDEEIGGAVESSASASSSVVPSATPMPSVTPGVIPTEMEDDDECDIECEITKIREVLNRTSWRNTRYYGAIPEEEEPVVVASPSPVATPTPVADFEDDLEESFTEEEIVSVKKNTTIPAIVEDEVIEDCSDDEEQTTVPVEEEEEEESESDEETEEEEESEEEESEEEEEEEENVKIVVIEKTVYVTVPSDECLPTPTPQVPAFIDELDEEEEECSDDEEEEVQVTKKVVAKAIPTPTPSAVAEEDDEEDCESDDEDVERSPSSHSSSSYRPPLCANEECSDKPTATISAIPSASLVPSASPSLAAFVDEMEGFEDELEAPALEPVASPSVVPETVEQGEDEKAEEPVVEEKKPKQTMTVLEKFFAAFGMYSSEKTTTVTSE